MRHSIAIGNPPASASARWKRPRWQWLPIAAFGAMLLGSSAGCAFLAGAAVGGAGGYVAGHEAGEDEARDELDRPDDD